MPNQGTYRAFALCILDQRVGPFRADKHAAEEDAVEMGHATRDAHSQRIYLTVPAEIGVYEFRRID